MKKIVLASVAAFVVLAAGGFVAGLYSSWVPNRNLSDSGWLEGATAGEIREASHRMLRWPWGNHHDACLYLEHVGCAESVPVLVGALDWVDDSEPPDRSASCSLAHCFDALRALTDRERGGGGAPPPRPRLLWRVGGGSTRCRGGLPAASGGLTRG